LKENNINTGTNAHIYFRTTLKCCDVKITAKKMMNTGRGWNASRQAEMPKNW